MRTFALLILLASALGGCATVAPYEREYLTTPVMDGEMEEGEGRFRGHVFDSREGATGGSESTGGGCGCN